MFRKYPFGEPKAVLPYASVVSIPMGNLTVLCLRFNLLVLLRALVGIILFVRHILSDIFIFHISSCAICSAVNLMDFPR